MNSDADKVASVQAAIAAEPQPIHVPRERPALVEIDDGPLVLVETRKDLRSAATAVRAGATLTPGTIARTRAGPAFEGRSGFLLQRPQPEYAGHPHVERVV